MLIILFLRSIFRAISTINSSRYILVSKFSITCCCCTHYEERRPNAIYFDLVFYFECRRGFRHMNTTNFRINIQSAKSCMTGAVMQQMMIDLIFFPYALQAMQACIVKYNTHNSAQFVVKVKGVHVICTLLPGKITVARTTVKNKSI